MDVEKTRKILLIVLAIQIVLTLVSIILGFIGDVQIGSLVIDFIRVAYLLLFVYVVIKYNQQAIYIFAILSIISAILVSISFILLIVAVIALYSVTSSAQDREFTAVIIVALVLTAIQVILSILQAVYSFKLNNLLKGRGGSGSA